MPYNFSFYAANRDEAIAELARRIDAEVAEQPLHAIDRDTVIGTAEAVSDLLRAPAEGEQLAIALHVFASGSAEDGLAGVAVTMSAQIATPLMVERNRPPAPSDEPDAEEPGNEPGDG